MSFRNGMRPVHPGEVLREEYMKPLGLSANALAKSLKVPTPRVNEIVRERRGVSADTALRLARYFGGDARSWLNLQAAYDLRVAEKASARKRTVQTGSFGSASERRVDDARATAQGLGRTAVPVHHSSVASSVRSDLQAGPVRPVLKHYDSGGRRGACEVHDE
jgi:addiction module HigA family antidote